MELNTIANEQSAFDLLPTEICKMITDTLKKDGSSSDLLNLSKAFKRFDIILKPTENEWKFHLVCPFIIPYLTGTQILNCRTVCKSWRQDVDTVLSNFDAWGPFTNKKSDISRSSDYNPLQMRRIKWTTFRRTEDIEKYIKEVTKQRMKNMIVGGSLAIREPSLRFDESNIFWEKSMDLVLSDGLYIKHLLLQPSNIKPRQFFQCLIRMLNCTPNLKTLQFDGYFTLNVVDYSGNQDQESLPEKLLEYLEKNPIPRLQSLQTLELLLLSNHFPIQVFQKMISDICPTDLKCLKLCYHVGEPEMYNPFIWQHPLASLTELHLVNIKNEQELERIMESVDVRNTQIKKLVLEFEDYLDNIDFDRLCIAINKLQMTLTVLAIKGVHSHEVNGNIQRPTLRRLETPHLKSLELEGVIFDHTIQFPILSQSLEYLFVRCSSTLPNVNRFFQWIISYVVNRWPGYNSFWNEMIKLKLIRLDVLNEHIWMSRTDEFANICFRNDVGYNWELCQETLTY